MEASVVTTSSGNTGPLGQPRASASGSSHIVTLGFYSWYWVCKTEEEMGKHTGEGFGGVLGLVIWILIQPVMAFVIPSEIGKMYRKDGPEPPVSGWTGLWLFPGRNPHHPGHRLVREGAGRSERLLGVEGRDGP